MQTDLDTYDTAVRVMGTRGRPGGRPPLQRRFDTALALFEQQNVDTEEFTRALGLAHSAVVTPLMFEYQLLEKARTSRKRIVLPEGNDDRVLKAGHRPCSPGASPTDDPRRGGGAPRARARHRPVRRAGVLSPFDPVIVDRFAREYADLRP